MDARWFKNCSTLEQKEARKKKVKSFEPAFEELRALLEREEKKTPDYSSPSWAYEQADTNGANRMLDQILKLLDTKD